MESEKLGQACSAGYARLVARAALLDRINVFPVADGDTGANLRLSLAPLRDAGEPSWPLVERLRRAATGNSGNIACAFVAEFLAPGPLDLAAGAERGGRCARAVVANPREGTMLSLFDALAEVLSGLPVERKTCPEILAVLRRSVAAGPEQLPLLREAGVVDAGALGLYLFLDGFFRGFTGFDAADQPLAELFPRGLSRSASFRPRAIRERCVEFLLRPAPGRDFGTAEAGSLGDSAVVVAGTGAVKVHLHSDDPEGLKRRLGRYGEILSWSEEAMEVAGSPSAGSADGRLHIMTDAAGSLSRELAGQHTITLLDSYVVSGDLARPESLCEPLEVYGRLRRGERVTTAQASLSERHQCYRSVCEEYGDTLYLATGSAFTGNYAAACAWQKSAGEGGCLTVLDSGAASGRLALIALLTARYAATADGAATLARARELMESCREYVFIDRLRYLVAGGRVSRGGGFFGDFLRLKPVISPTPAGVVRVGLVRSRRSQLSFAARRLRKDSAAWRRPVVLLQYSDNEPWLRQEAEPLVRRELPGAEIILQPLSLTSGVHMGPGTWSLALAAEE